MPCCPPGRCRCDPARLLPRICDLADQVEAQQLELLQVRDRRGLKGLDKGPLNGPKMTKGDLKPGGIHTRLCKLGERTSSQHFSQK